MPPRSGTWLMIEELLYPDQLIHTGTDLSEPEIAQSRRAEAERMRAARPNVFSRALMGATDWVTARLATTRVHHYRQDYKADAQLDGVIIKTDGSIVTDRDGAAIMGYSWQPQTAGNVVRVTVAVPAWARQRNSVVVALFLNGAPEARAVASQGLQPGQASTAVLGLEIATRSTQAIDLSVRVGAGEPGTVIFNSGAGESIPNLSNPTLTIEEYAPFWR
jgi:hypothetical protein